MCNYSSRQALIFICLVSNDSCNYILTIGLAYANWISRTHLVVSVYFHAKCPMRKTYRIDEYYNCIVRHKVNTAASLWTPSNKMGFFVCFHVSVHPNCVILDYVTGIETRRCPLETYIHFNPTGLVTLTRYM